MAIPERLTQFLDSRKIPYRTELHTEAVTAQQAAQAAHVPGRAFAKAVLLYVDGKLWMAVLPATERVDMQRLRSCLGSKKVRMATEAEFATVFPDCDLGAMPIFGSLYGLPVIASGELQQHEEIAFTAGTHHEIVRIRTRDFLDAEQPKVCGREEILA
ncbi:MAG: aminoacyl-tRNA deacylase [Verrucomicrobiota bacterium]